MSELPIPKEDETEIADIIENDEFRQWIQDDSVLLSEAVESTINNIIKNKQKKLQIFLLSLVSNRINKLNYLFKQEDVLSNILFDEEKLKDLKASQLISLFRTVHSQIKDTLEFFDYLSKQEVDLSGINRNVGDHIDSKLQQLSPESRNKLRTVISMLFSEVEKEEKNKGLPEK